MINLVIKREAEEVIVTVGISMEEGVSEVEEISVVEVISEEEGISEVEEISVAEGSFVEEEVLKGMWMMNKEMSQK
jgi:uracil phosphoribosyltransferase